MKNNKNFTQADRVSKGTSCPVPEDIKAIEFIQKVTAMLDEWVKQDKRRAFFIIAGTENASNEDARGLAVGNGGEDIELAHIACAALENNEDFRKAMFHACMLKESVNEENDNNDKQFN